MRLFDKNHNSKLTYEEGEEVIIEMGLEAYDAEDYQKAFEIWSKLSDSGDASAKFKLGCTYYGLIESLEEENEKLGFDFFAQSAELGHDEAMHALGILYQEGTHFFPEPDAHKSREWLIRAADNGSTKAMSEIGILFLKGEDKTILESDAKRHLMNAHEHGDAKATNALGILFENHGDGSKAIQYFFEAAENGYANSFTNLAQRFKSGLDAETYLDRAINLAADGIKDEFSEGYYAAFSLLEAVAIKPYNSPEAQNMLGIRAVYSAKYSALKIITGQFAPDPNDDSELWEQIFPISQIINQYPDEMDKLLDSNGFPRFPRTVEFERLIGEADKYFRLAADNGHLGATFNLGMLINLGLHEDYDKTEGEQLIIKAADLGNVDAQLEHAIIVDRKHPKTKQAFDLFFKCAENGNSTAAFEIARRYDFGHGVEQDTAEAATFYKLSITQSNQINNSEILAQFNLGLLYVEGHGVQKSIEEAYRRVSFASSISERKGSLGDETKEHIRSVEEELAKELGPEKVEELSHIKKNYATFID